MTYVLIPGAGGSAWYWHRLEPELRRRGHATVAVSLPADDDSAGLPEYTNAVVDAADDRPNLVLVAQSLGAFTAPLVCARLPVQMLILLNPMTPNPNETPGEWWANTGHREAKRANDLREGRPLQAEFDWRVDFFHDVPPAVAEEAAARGAPRQSETVFGSVCAFTTWPAVPIRVLVGRDDRFFPVEFQRRVARERLGIVPDEMPGGHLVALSRPAELAERLAAYAQSAQAGGPPGAAH